MPRVWIICILAYPYLGANPDDVISCNCCVEGILEIKCARTSWKRLISGYITQPESCLTYDDSNKISLKNSRPYMHQTQHQMFVTGRLYCDFEGFLVKESVTIRIMKDLIMKMTLCQNVLISMMNFLFLSFLQNLLKLKGPAKSYWKILWCLWNNLELVVRKKCW